MRGKTFARPRCPLRPVFVSLAKFAINRGKASLDLLKSEVYLLVIYRQPQTLGARTILGTLQNLQDRRQSGDPLVGFLLDSLHSGDFGLSRSLLCAHRDDHRFQRFDVVRKVGTR